MAMVRKFEVPEGTSKKNDKEIVNDKGFGMVRYG